MLTEQQTETNQTNDRKYLVPFILITSLFFLWGFARAILDVLNKHFQNALHISITHSALIQVTTYLGYFLMAIPAGFFINRYGYRRGVVFGLLLFGLGSLLFIPGAAAGSFYAFLGCLFIIGCGLVFLETAANPYVTELGAKETATSRLNLSQSFNGLGGIFATLCIGQFLFRSSGDSGNVVIPSFAVGRTQEILYFIREIKEKNLLPEFPGFEVYVDSPLAIEATNVFNKNVKGCFDEEAMELVNQGINPLLFRGLKTTITSDESRQINFDTKPKVILSASGMCEAGRIRHHLKHNLWRPECTICFVGYQAVGTLGRKLIEGAESVKLFGENITVNARIEVLKGISGHADMNGLLDWIRGFEKIPDRVMVVHGEDTVTDTFGCPAFAPYSGGSVDLAANEIITIGQKIPKKSDEKPSKLKSASAFNRLVAAAKRLLNVVYKNEGIANKDMAKFETQIQNLAAKWDR